MLSSPPTAAEQSSGVKGIAQASPQDGQNVAQMPQLVWDNHGGAGLQVVEWQRGEGGAWSDATAVPGGGPQPDAAHAGAGGVRQCEWTLSVESVERGRAWRRWRSARGGRFG